MPAKPNERQYRSLTCPMTAQKRDGEGEEKSYLVKGYATTFNDPYTLYEWDGVAYREQIDPGAFEGADMSDVIFQYDHSGRVFARQSNGTLKLSVDEHGLFVEADLSGSAQGRELYEEIANGLVCRMSWCFVPTNTGYDEKTHLSTIYKVSKVYDVSAVSIPADPNTEISARSFLNGVIEQAGRTERASRRKRAALKAKAAMALH